VFTHILYNVHMHRPGAYLYEVWLTLYKLLLSGLLVYFQPGTASQAVVALLITLLALWVSLTTLSSTSYIQLVYI
jgi:hypothetical protein